jgi:hypothetical protein
MKHVLDSLDVIVGRWKRQLETDIIRTVIDSWGYLLFCLSILLDAGHHCKVAAGAVDGGVA